MSAPFIKGSETSRAAAENIEPKLPRREYEVMRYIRECGYGGVTDDQLMVHFTRPPYNWAEPTARARRVRLCEKGLLRDSGSKRPTRFNRWATIWALAEREPELFDGREP